MSTLQEKLSELLSLTQMHLLREYSPGSKVYASRLMRQTLKPAIKKQERPNPQPQQAIPATQAAITPPPVKPLTPPVVPSTPKLSQQPAPPPVASVSSSKSGPPQPFPFSFELDPIKPSVHHVPSQEIVHFFKEQHPQIALTDAIPPDHEARKICSQWKLSSLGPAVLVLSFHDDPKEEQFLSQLALAISYRFGLARVVQAWKLQKGEEWTDLLNAESLKLVISSDYGPYLQPALAPLYRESPQDGKHFLAHLPLLLLSDPSLYLKEPQLKAPLWQAIKKECMTLFQKKV